MLFSSVAIAGIWLCWHISLRAAGTTGLFYSDPRHISNRLYRQLHVRRDSSGKEHGFDALDPLLWNDTNYLLDAKSWSRTLALADEFLRTHAERQITNPTKRAILQRDVWAIFDWVDQPDLPHQAERRELMERLAAIVRRLALVQNELTQLPDTYVRALQNHEFPAAYDAANPNQAFLPPDLFDPNGPWVCLGAPDHGLAAPLHDSSFTARSVFFVFARLPGGRAATLEYFKRLAELKVPLFVSMREPGWPQPMEVWNPQVPQFPVGTEFALIRKMVLPDRDGHLRLTPVTESVQIRHYTDIPNVDPMASRDVALAQRFQDPSAIDLSRVLLFSEHHSGLRGVTATDDPFLIFPAMSQGFDPFEDRRMRGHVVSSFVECNGCHLGPGTQSMMSFSFRANPNEGPALSPRLSETTLPEESEKVLNWARTQGKWKDLLRLWSSESSH
jgi:hypothetical protein